MNDFEKHALINRLTAMADDELILAHRDAEWTGHAPILEEDIALANLAQDELGHATTLYGLVETLTGRTPDQLAYFRSASGFRNVQLVELPKGDWAFTMLRQYLFDAYEHLLYAALADSAYQPLADVVAKFKGEELYHLRHSHVWVERLGLGTEESNRRMQTALNELWPYCRQLFLRLPDDQALITSGQYADVATLRQPWEAVVIPHLQASGLIIPTNTGGVGEIMVGRDEHTDHLVALLADMQQVARLDPEAEW